MHITARTEYALRAMLALAAADPSALTAAALASGQRMPATFLKTILSELRGAELIVNQRGPERGYRLVRPAAQITVGEILRIVDGPLDLSGETLADWVALRRLQLVWRAADSAMRDVVDRVSLADLLSGDLPDHVRQLGG